MNLCLGCFFEALTDRSSGNKVIHSGRPLAGRSRGTDIPVRIFFFPLSTLAECVIDE